MSQAGASPKTVPAATETAAENAARNGIELPMRTADALSAALPPADIAVANIALDVVTEVAPRLAVETVVASGYLESEQPELAGLRRVARRTSDGWAADLYRRV